MARRYARRSAGRRSYAGRGYSSGRVRARRSTTYSRGRSRSGRAAAATVRLVIEQQRTPDGVTNVARPGVPGTVGISQNPPRGGSRF